MNRRAFFTRLTTAAAPAAAVALAPAAVAGVVRAVATGRKNIPNVAVTGQDGKTYRFYDDLVKNRIVLINMFYADCAGICPRMTSNLARIRKLLGDRVGRDIFIYSISLKPEEDTVENLEHYAGMHGIAEGSGWLLLRANRPDMELLRERLGFKDSDPVLDSRINEHTGIVRFGNEPYDRWGACPLLGKPETIASLVLATDPNSPQRGF